MRIKYTIILMIILTASISFSYNCISEHHKSLYNVHSYCCKHMGRDLEDTLESIFIPVKIEIGKTKGNHEINFRHLWISINGYHIDSVSLTPAYYNVERYSEERYTFDDYSDYEEHLIKRSMGFNQSRLTKLN